MVQVHQLCHCYASGRAALSDVTFTLQAGERVGLLGSNGAGKTTLFLRLSGVLSGPLGQARVHHLDPADPVQRRQLPRHLGLVFQNPDDQLVGSTLLEDVAFGPLNLGVSAKEAEALAMAALAQVRLSDRANQPPHRLSGGEKRRAALAGVLAMSPSVLLLDEPSMFLDPPGRRELIGWLGDWPGTQLIASHDLPFVAKLCPRVLVLQQGRLVYDGPTAEILQNSPKLAEYGLE